MGQGRWDTGLYIDRRREHESTKEIGCSSRTRIRRTRSMGRRLMAMLAGNPTEEIGCSSPT